MNYAARKLKTLNVKGKVFSGSGKGSKFTGLNWVKKQIEEKFGFSPYIGTLNIKLVGNNVDFKRLLKEASLEISSEKGFCRGRCFSAFFMNTVKCAIVVPEIANYPADVIEVIAPVNLRERFQLKDGDVVEVKIVF